MKLFLILTLVGCTCALGILPATLETPILDEVRSVDVGSQGSVLLPEYTPLILDCLPYANRTFGAQANLSSIQWFRIPTKHPESIGNLIEIIGNSTFHNVNENGEKLFIEKVTIATGVQEGTEAAYRCKVCRNNMPPDPLSCADATTIIDAYSPPVLECTDPPPPIDTEEILIIRDLQIGCDLCIEPGVTVDILTITCKPRTGRPTDCTMTTPNGTNVLDIFDPTGTQITTLNSGHVLSVSMSPAANPDHHPLGFDVLGNWACQCNNSNGRVVAYSKLGTCSANKTCEIGNVTYKSGEIVPNSDRFKICTCAPGLAPDEQHCIRNDPPECTFEYCRRNGKGFCYKYRNQRDSRLLTSCMVAYYSMDERPAPPKCTTKELCTAGPTVDRLPERYLNKWANCVKKEFRAEHGRTRRKFRKERFFKILTYPC